MTENLNSWEKAVDKCKSVFSGGLAGCLSRSSVAPIERIIILRQTHNIDYLGLSIRGCMEQMYRREGVVGWFRGNGATCIRIAPFQATEFVSFEYYRHWARKWAPRDTSTVLINLLTGATAGMTASTVVYPIDLVRTLLVSQTQQTTQPRKYKGLFSSIVLVARQDGVGALYRGWGTTMAGIAPYAACKLSSFQFLKAVAIQHGLSNNNNVVIANLVMGAIAGCFAVTVTYPTDLLRKMMQVQVLQKTNNSLPQVIQHLWSNQGIKGFYKGLGATYLKVLPSTALAFAINEYMKALLGVKGPNKQ